MGYKNIVILVIRQMLLLFFQVHLI